MYKIINLDIDGSLTGETRISEIAMVEQPAIEQNFIYFSEQKSYIVPQNVSSKACKARKYKEENGTSCGTPVGWTRSSQLCSRSPISLDTVKRMYSYLSRHKVDLESSKSYEQGCGLLMYDAWGGEPAFEWSKRIVEREKEMDMDIDVSALPEYVNYATGDTEDNMLIKEFAGGERVSFDYDVLNTPRGRGLALSELQSGSKVYIIGEYANMRMRPLAKELGIDNIQSLYGERDTVRWVKLNNIDRHYTDNQEVLDKLGGRGMDFNCGCLDEFAEVGPRGGIKESKKAPKSDTPNPNPKGEGTAKGDASTTRGAKVTAAQEKTLQGKVDDFNEKESNTKNGRATLGALKSVFQRGLGAYNTSRSPNVSSAQQWAYARVNAYLYLLKNGRPQNKKYTTDNDLLPKDHPKSSKEKMGQEFEEGIPHYTADGELYEGPTHKDESGRLMTGEVHTEDSEYLYHEGEFEGGCWDGYEPIGKKMKDGREVPNCVPIKASQEEFECVSIDGCECRLFTDDNGNEVYVPRETEPVEELSFGIEEYSNEEKEAAILLQQLKEIDYQAFERIVGELRGATAPQVRRRNHQTPTPYYLYKRIDSGEPHRDFCDSIEGRYFTRFEIDLLTDTNVEFGHERKAYSKWLYKGGPNCIHAWVRVVAIGSTIREVGVVPGTPGIPPKRLPNNGYFSPETKRRSQVAYIIEQKEKGNFAAQKEKRMIYSPLMIPHILIPRMDDDGEKYFVRFTPESIEKMQQLYMIEKRLDKTNYEHSDKKIPSVVMVESWIISGDNDKAYQLGFKKEDLPVGTWMSGFKVLETEDGNIIWNDFVKTGKLKGFSVEGDFLLKFSREKTDEYLLNELINILKQINN